MTLGDLDANARWLHKKVKGLGDVLSEELLRRGSRLAYDPELVMRDRNSGLDSVERKALEEERTSGIWQQSKELKTILATCCVGAIVQYVALLFPPSRMDYEVQHTWDELTQHRGWDQASITGANLSWPEEMGLSDVHHGSDKWKFGAVNAISFFAAATV